MQHASELQYEIEQFLYEEARLLDEGRYHEWLALLADDVRYWMPVRESVQGSASDIVEGDLAFALFDDDKASLMMRVDRLDTGLAYAETPASITQRIISNVQVKDTAVAEEKQVRSSFVLYQGRPGRHESLFIGRREDRVRRVGDGWQLVRRAVYLAQPVLPRTISIFF